ncbi:MAG: hypothetical protein HY291_13560 [Planctomycetes bacterium]|nr:hypothetical protein [Planctomycetota bacterium]
MKASTPAAQPAPTSERWRRVARTGALLAFLATLIPINGKNVWGAWDEILELAMMSHDWDNRVEMAPALLFCLFSPAVYFACIINLVLFSARIYGKSRLSHLYHALAVLLWVGILAPAYIFTALRMRALWNSPWGGVLLAVMSLYLLAGALCFLMARHSTQMVRKLFWLEILPLLAAVIAYTGILVWFLTQTRSNLAFYLFASLGLLGSLMMAGGVMLWWRALVIQDRQLVRTAAEPS